MSRNLRSASVMGILATAVALASCSEPTEPSGEPSLIGPSSLLLQCPTATSKSTTKLVVPILGGLVSLDGTSIRLLSGALSAPTFITVALPASQYMETEITANNLLHIVFNRPATVTIDYSRCGDVQGDITVWHIDPVTKVFLEDMGGTDDRAARKITFTTGHLSSYAIANRAAPVDDTTPIP